MRLVLLAAILMCVVACGGGSPTLHGTVILHSSSISHSGTKCSGTDGFDDLTAGAPVTVKNGSGSVIAAGSLDEGVSDAMVCRFQFTITNVPDAKSYLIGVTHRGPWTYSQDQLLTKDWTLLLSIGD
jgi:hypothetical protein